MKFEKIIQQGVLEALSNLYFQTVDKKNIQIQNTRREFTGDLTVVVFPFLSISRKTPEQTGQEIGAYLKTNIQQIADYNVINGFLNIEINSSYWLKFFNTANAKENFGIKEKTKKAETVVIEYSSPNTNKPLHLGHIRNNLLGWSIAEILKANGKNVVKVNLVNDRGIHICKSMLAWLKFGNGETPTSSDTKGDHLVGKYYVLFEKEYRKQIAKLKDSGVEEKIAKEEAPIILEAREMLRKWERNDKKTLSLWKKMNKWVYKGFDKTYTELGVDFDKTYYESETYKLGKSIILNAFESRYIWMKRKKDGSIWADLTKNRLDEKILLRADGTSVYITQDIGTANERFKDYQFNKHIYVVGNEQNYHFKVLKIVLKKLGNKWANKLLHLSYGMVDLPSGRMKSREGFVVDADDLIAEMIITAKQTSQELGKLNDYSQAKANKVIKTVALGALKYFILKVDPKRRMLFNPQESIDFNGNTGPFIQYTYARIQSVLRKAKEQKIEFDKKVAISISISKKEVQLIKLIDKFPEIVTEAGKNLSPALIANYCYELVKEYNQFYHDYSILREEIIEFRNFRLALSNLTGRIIKTSMNLLGIDVPEKM
jgi:arginyl-tRNA synthetase